jgi:hypothetical protein
MTSSTIPDWLRRLVDRLLSAEPKKIAPKSDPLKAELEFINLISKGWRRWFHCEEPSRLDPLNAPELQHGLVGFTGAYGRLLDDYLDLTERILAQRGVSVSPFDRQAWRNHIIREFCCLVVDLEDSWVAEEVERNSVKRLLAWCSWGWRLIIKKKWQRYLEQRKESGMRRSLGCIVEEHISLCCTMMMGDLGPL